VVDTRPGDDPEEEGALAEEVAQVAAEDLVAEDLVAEEGGRIVWNPIGQMLQISKAPRYWKNGSKPMKMFD
tara:strand:- start:354 stop:566 length:213 start_codon:yes stop_codon:yes gene_type:complete